MNSRTNKLKTSKLKTNLTRDFLSHKKSALSPEIRTGMVQTVTISSQTTRREKELMRTQNRMVNQKRRNQEKNLKTSKTMKTVTAIFEMICMKKMMHDFMYDKLAILIKLNE